MSIYQSLTTYFRAKFINSLQQYSIESFPDNVNSLNIFSKLPKWLLNELNTIVEYRNNLKNEILLEQKQKQEKINNQQQNYSDLKKKILSSIDNEINANLEIMKNRDEETFKLKNKLFILEFDKELLAHEAIREINLLGFKPINILEFILFISKYENIVLSRPLIALNSYYDASESFKEIYNTFKRPNIDLCMCYSFDDEFTRPGGIEAGEAYLGAIFSKNVSFIVKSF